VLRGVPADKLGLDFWRPGYAQRSAQPDPRAAGAGDWVVRLTPTTSLAFTGSAKLADGTPLGEKPIELWVKDRQGGSDMIRATTDAEGRFQAALNHPGPFSGEAWTEDRRWQVVVNERFHPELRRRWRATFDALRPGTSVDLRFQNEGHIEVQVQPAQSLPEGDELAVMLHMGCPPDGRWEQADAQKLGPSGGVVRFQSLAPGTYKVRVFLAHAEGMSWEKSVVLSEKEQPLAARLVFPLPRISYGDAKLAVVDGQGGPVPRARGAWYAPGGQSGSFEVHAGRAELKRVSAETVLVRVSARDDAGEFRRDIHSGQVTDLGTLVLQPRQAADVKGRVLYEDGTPVLGACLEFGKPVGADGTFEATLPQTADTLGVDLSRAPAWLESSPAASAGSPHDFFRWSRYFVDTALVRVSLKPGQTVTRDVTIDRKRRRTLTVAWRGEQPQGCAILAFVERDGQGHRRGAYLGLKEATPVSMPDLPDGQGLLVLSGSDYLGYATLMPGPQTLTFDRARAGSIVGRVLRADKSPAARVRLTLKPDPAADDTARGPVIPCVSPLPMIAGTPTAEDGTFRFPAVGEGTYALATLNSDNPARLVVSVKPGVEARVELISDAASEGPPPLRDVKHASPEAPSTSSRGLDE
jgi:hypothetical protein